MVVVGLPMNENHNDDVAAGDFVAVVGVGVGSKAVAEESESRPHFELDSRQTAISSKKWTDHTSCGEVVFVSFLD